jgi:soluble lytic murein transglycosylase-like protein
MHVFSECEKYNIAPGIVFAIMWRESRFQADVVSPHGSIGLMQIAPKWHEESMERLGCHDLFDPYQNITVGIDYLAYLKEQSSDIVWVLTAYRWGEGKATSKMESGDMYAINVLEKSSEFQREIEDAR